MNKRKLFLFIFAIILLILIVEKKELKELKIFSKPTHHEYDINVKEYGAKGDCILDSNGKYISGTDDTKAIISAIKATPKNGTLFFPKGNYYYHYIDIVRSDITIVGNKASLVSYVLPKSSKNAFHIIGSNIAIRNLEFKYDRPFNYNTTYKPSAFGSSNTIRLGGEHPDKPNGGWQQNITIENCIINGGYSGGIDIYFASNARVINNKVTNTLGNGINFANCLENIVVEKNLIKNTRDDGIQNVCDENVPSGTKNYTVKNNKVINSYAKGISTTGVDGALITENYVKNTWGGGIQPFSDTYYGLGLSKNVTVIKNQIFDSGRNFGANKYKTKASSNADGIYISSNTDNVKITDNKIRNSFRHGIVAVNGSDIIDITNNSIENNNGNGINIGNVNDLTYHSASDVNISNNRIKDVGEYGIAIGGTNKGLISNNNLKNWGNTNYPIYVKNSCNINISENIFNSLAKNSSFSIVRLEGKLINVKDINNQTIFIQ